MNQNHEMYADKIADILMHDHEKVRHEMDALQTLGMDTIVQDFIGLAIAYTKKQDELTETINYYKSIGIQPKAMEEEKRQQNRPYIEVHGSYYEIHDNTFLGGTHCFGTLDRNQNDNEEELDLSEESVKHAIDLLMRSNIKQNKRWWFIPYRVLKDAAIVADLYSFEQYINRLYDNNLPLCIDVHDLSKEVEVFSFAKPYKEWKSDDAPVSVATYKKYADLIESFISYLKII